MQYNVSTVKDYIATLPESRRSAIEKLRNVILSNLPDGFDEQISAGMISYVVPLSKYPQGYHAKKGEPLPFISLASQKNHIALYHMGMYGNKALAEWFVDEYAKRVPSKLDMGKSCIRFKKPDTIPYDLIADLCRKINADEYIKFYKETVQKE
jgi:uncharacterized protein YdhG (YjbR/CyaY superfamily)